MMPKLQVERQERMMGGNLDPATRSSIGLRLRQPTYADLRRQDLT